MFKVVLAALGLAGFNPKDSGDVIIIVSNKDSNTVIETGVVSHIEVLSNPADGIGKWHIHARCKDRDFGLCCDPATGKSTREAEWRFFVQDIHEGDEMPVQVKFILA